MGIIRMRVEIPGGLAGVGSDNYVNTWYFRYTATSTAAGSCAEAEGWLTTFYNTIDALMPDALINSPAIVKGYDMNEPEPRAPIFEDTISLVPGGTEALPPELSVCLSYRATYSSGVTKGRRRGRVYLGPWLLSLSTDGRPDLTSLTTPIKDAADALLTSSQASTDTIWCVFSPTVGVVGSDSVNHNVTGGWVDDEFDVQRRRGLSVTGRTEFGAGH